ncbi:polysaccharide deacetylase family protein [Agathobaculum sp.]|uniref:polysaccharide deacetylase family protein n=1 Tax=Agathobaculum sp. TaxID=2048138 RepID=UPI002A7EAACC|nr:polysaccharide deacetylase family protein [Agathobaculum sp.]MDY3618529.1 polysaccharide deacetylase family protein [Agathobaculum sp.]
MKLGFRRTAVQALCTVLILCGLIGGTRVWGRDMPVAAFGKEEGVELPILMYHSILKDGARQGKYVLSPNALAADLDYLKKEGYETITVADLLAYVKEGAALPQKPVMITFDDGYFNNYVYAYPLLKDRGMRAVVSVIGSQTALFTENGEENAYWSHLKLEHLEEMQDVFEVQNHSWNLHEYGERRGCLRRKGEDEVSYESFLREDTEQTQELLVEAGLPEPTCYTYPFGACSKESEQVLRSMGFQCTLGCSEQINTVTRDPECLYGMGRFNRPAGVSTSSYMKKALGE